LIGGGVGAGSANRRPFADWPTLKGDADAIVFWDFDRSKSFLCYSLFLSVIELSA
jgi:hypothetical protein